VAARYLELAARKPFSYISPSPKINQTAAILYPERGAEVEPARLLIIKDLKRVPMSRNTSMDVCTKRHYVLASA
jgi:hypothetical protein